MPSASQRPVDSPIGCRMKCARMMGRPWAGQWDINRPMGRTKGRPMERPMIYLGGCFSTGCPLGYLMGHPMGCAHSMGCSVECHGRTCSRK